ncbi:MAG: type II toxin-antitoxin system RelE/ParE family toxin [Acidobacteria bacterium]|nr:MAG: type II toxin-antitoxin system RelE/ParE family toxin [Acidobacteriota bacterium]PYV28850.1 MAG: type II toxin-antitoxin system RelE/ParE family toxin [Acidobacteriota bacterium]
MAQVRWTPQAADDLDAICLFIARDAPTLAAIFADRVLRASDRLASHPRLGRVVPELGNENIREIIVGSYRVIYRIQREQVHLLTVHHGARPLDTTKIDAGS